MGLEIWSHEVGSFSFVYSTPTATDDKSEHKRIYVKEHRLCTYGRVK